MSRIKGRDTKIEFTLRNLLWNNGLRGYRIKNKIYGKPDIYFPKKRISIFIDGCFWHKCKKCFREPKSNKIFWKNKIENNVKRDQRVNKILKNKGIIVLRFWEHEIKKNTLGCFNKIKKSYDER